MASTRKNTGGKSSRKASSKKDATMSSRRLRSMPVNALLALDVSTHSLMATALAQGGCRARAIATIQQWGGGVVQGGSDTLSQLSVNAPCTQARVNVLKGLLGASFQMSCSTSVGSILSRLCPIQ